MVIVDPVTVVPGDSHKNTEVRRALQPLVGFATELDAAVFGVSHFTKGTAGRDPVERMLIYEGLVKSGSEIAAA